MGSDFAAREANPNASGAARRRLAQMLLVRSPRTESGNDSVIAGRQREEQQRTRPDVCLSRRADGPGALSVLEIDAQRFALAVTARAPVVRSRRAVVMIAARFLTLLLTT